MVRKAKLITWIYNGYQMLHILFDVFWVFRVVKCNWLWWMFWIIPLVFVYVLCTDQKVKKEVDDLEQVTARKILTLIWVVFGGLSGMIHSPI